MKKKLSILLALVMTLSIAGCNNKEKNLENTEGTKVEENLKENEKSSEKDKEDATDESIYSFMVNKAEEEIKEELNKYLQNGKDSTEMTEERVLEIQKNIYKETTEKFNITEEKANKIFMEKSAKLQKDLEQNFN